MKLRPSPARTLRLVLAIGLSLAGCAPRPPATAPTAADALARRTEALLARFDAYHVDALPHRRFSPQEYWDTLDPVLRAGAGRVHVAQIGHSVEGRPLRRIDFGQGAIPVLLWSQMHGDESTASRALVDVLQFLLQAPEDPYVQHVERRLHVTFVPLLNPDGAARFVRHNAVGIDINRDARRLASPEARALKQVRDETDARWGFNLHDQNVRTRLGGSGRDVLIALLAPPPGPSETSAANAAARRMCSLVAMALEPVVGDQVARYDESFNPRAFGDLMTRWGTSVVLIESGGEISDPDKARLRRANFVAILSALDAIATGQWKTVSARRYLSLPLNSPWVYDLVIRGALIALPGSEPVRADLAINYRDTLAKTAGSIVEVGDLEQTHALESIDVSGLYFLPRIEPAGQGVSDRLPLQIGDPANGVLSRDPAGQQPVWVLRDGRLQPADQTSNTSPRSGT